MFIRFGFSSAGGSATWTGGNAGFFDMNQDMFAHAAKVDLCVPLADLREQKVPAGTKIGTALIWITQWAMVKLELLSEGGNGVKIVWPECVLFINSAGLDSRNAAIANEIRHLVHGPAKKPHLDRFSSPPSSLPWPALGLTGAVPEEEARKAYREAAKKAHPDMGGTDEKMTKVNKAWEEICRAKGWK